MKRIYQIAIGMTLTAFILLLSAGCTKYIAKTAPEVKRNKGPYLLYRGNPSEMALHWQGRTTFKSRLRWGTDTACTLGNTETTEYGNDHQHTYTIKNLAPGIRTFYELNMDGEIYQGSFMAAPPDTTTELKFLIYGDSRSHPEIHDQVAQGMIMAYTSDPALQTMVFNVGDLVKFGAVESDWDQQMFSSDYPHIMQLMAGLPYQVSVGNHELYGKNYRSMDKQFRLFKKYFPYPFVDHAYWSFDYGPAHFIMVDQYASPDYNPRKHGIIAKEQLAWIEKDLAASPKAWKFIFFHEPGWSALGGHDNNPDVQQSLQPLMEKYGVSILFAGHNHYYARAVVNRTHHVTTGGGGAPIRHPDPEAPFVVATAGRHHFCIVDISGNRLTFSALAPDGTVIDSFTTSR